MYYVCKPTRIAIYVNSGRKTAAAIQRELGCDVLINGSLYDMRAFAPYCWLKKDGSIIHSEAWSDFGYGWEENKLIMDTTVNIGGYRNFITCVAMILHGKALNMVYPTELGGKRGRSAIGVRENGEVVIYCTQDGTSWAMTPEALQREMQTLGCDSALMLDGGGSSQCLLPIGAVRSSRIVQNYIALWREKESSISCPYSEPTRMIRWGSMGDGAKWVQWQLNRHGATLDVDGLFFGQSVSALKAFQSAQRLVVDGVCGEKTREALVR